MVYNGISGGWFDSGGPAGNYSNNGGSRINSPVFYSPNSSYPLFLTVEMSVILEASGPFDTLCVHLRNSDNNPRMFEFYPVLSKEIAWYPVKDTQTTLSACNPNVLGFCTGGARFFSGLTKTTFFIPPVGNVSIEFAFRSDASGVGNGFQIKNTELCPNSPFLSSVQLIPATPCKTFDFTASSQNWLSDELGTSNDSMCYFVNTRNSLKMLYNPGIGWSDHAGTAGNYSNNIASRIVSPPVVISSGVNNILTLNLTLQTDGSVTDLFCIYIYNAVSSAFTSFTVLSSSLSWTSVSGGTSGSCHRSSTNAIGRCAQSFLMSSGIHKFTIPLSISAARIEFTFVSGGAPSAPGWIIRSAGLCST
jgi:hypothetical protein